MHPVSAPDVTHTTSDKNLNIVQLRSPNLRDPYQYLPRSRSMETAPPSNQDRHKLTSVSHDQMMIAPSPLSCSLSHVSSCSEESEHTLGSQGSMDSEKAAPLARFDTMSELQSGSSVSTVASSSDKSDTRPPYPPVDGYCYYTDVELASPKSQMGPHSGRHTPSASPSPSPSPSEQSANQITTTADIEPNPVTTDSTQFLLPNSPWPAATRGGVASAIQRFENMRNRTSTQDRYTLTYDAESIDSSTTLEGIPVRPSDLQFVPADGKIWVAILKFCARWLLL